MPVMVEINGEQVDLDSYLRTDEELNHLHLRGQMLAALNAVRLSEFRVVCDGTNNTPEDIEQGKLNVDLVMTGGLAQRVRQQLGAYQVQSAENMSKLGEIIRAYRKRKMEMRKLYNRRKKQARARTGRK